MDFEILREMVNKFLSEKIKELETELANNNLENIKSIAHKIKGNSGTAALELNRFNEIGRDLEQAVIQNLSPSIISEKIEELKAEFKKL